MWQKFVKVGKQYLMTLSLVLLSAVALASFFSSTDNRQIFAGLENKMSATSVGELGAASSTLSGYAWSSNIGWISMSGGAPYPYAVSIMTDKTLKGYAWSDNIGWIKFGGLTSCPVGSCDARLQDNWTLAGWARACAGTATGDCSIMTSRTDGWDGWISLSSANGGGGGTYGITFSSSTLAALDNSYAWGSDVVGWISWKPAYGGVVITSGNNNCLGNIPTGSYSYGAATTSVPVSWTLNEQYPDPDSTLSSCEYGCNNGYNTSTGACNANPQCNGTLPTDSNIVWKGGVGDWTQGVYSSLDFCQWDCKAGYEWNTEKCIQPDPNNCYDKPSPESFYIFSTGVHTGVPNNYEYDWSLNAGNLGTMACKYNCAGGYEPYTDPVTNVITCIPQDDGICGINDLTAMVGNVNTVIYAGENNLGPWNWVSTTTFAGTQSPECIFTCKDGYSYNSTTNKCETGPDPITGGCQDAKPITGPGTGVLVSPESKRQASTKWNYFDYDITQGEINNAGDCRWGCDMGYLPGVNKNCYRTGTTTQK